MVKNIHGALLSWYGVNRRDLPWRRNRDAYRVWISEIMLQQTRVETVIPYYERFLAHFPNITALAAADIDTLTSLWAGLGYYSRARNLRAAANTAMEKFAGELPKNFLDLRSLKGIGDYTAAAIASIAFGEPWVALDGNLERVLSRLLALQADPKGKSGRVILREFGQKLVALGSPGEINQALMDLSAAVCLPKTPRCSSCPVAEYCGARKKSLTQEIPWKRKKAETIELRSHGLILLREGDGGERALLLARRRAGDWLAGLWDLPWWLEESGWTEPKLKDSSPFGDHEVVRTITRHKIRYRVQFASTKKLWSADELRKSLPETCAAEFRWISLDSLEEVNLPRPSEKALAKAIASWSTTK